MDYSEIARQKALEYGVNPDLVLSLMNKESSKDPFARSNKGAYGLMQLMPGTARMLGGDINDPVQNIDMGVRYLRNNLDRFDGNEELAVAGYNAGPGNVKNGMVPNFSETRSHVAKVMSYKKSGADIFGLDDVGAAPPPGPSSSGADIFGLNDEGIDRPPVSITPRSVKQKVAPSPKLDPFDNYGQPEIGHHVTGNLAAGATRGLGSVLSTAAAPFDMAADAVMGKGLSLEGNRARRQGLDETMTAIGADINSPEYLLGRTGAEVAASYPVGGLLGRAAAEAFPAAPWLANSLKSGGMTLGAQAPGNVVGRGLARVIGGAVTGGASAGVVDPAMAPAGAAIGGAIPGAVAGLGATGKALTGGGVSPEVAALAQKAAERGINIPADRIGNSKPLNALAASLNYVPLSGRAATETGMINQLKRAASRTFGENSDNITMALRKARERLGGQFEEVLSQNGVVVDQQFLDDLATHASRTDELGPEGARVINNQIDQIISKAGNGGVVDGQTAYNIKKALDRIGKGSSEHAHYASELKRSLMEALNRSLPEETAASFATTRRQYGNMLELEKIALNGAEGDISVARLANMKHINNPDLQEIADISAQFIKPREGQHGSAQRAFLGGAGLTAGYFSPGAWPGIMAAIAGGRMANGALNSQVARNAATSGLLFPGLQGVGDMAQPLLPAAYQSSGLLGPGR